MPMTPKIAPVRRVEILGFSGVQLLDVAGPLQVFASANSCAAEAGRPVPYELQVVAPLDPVMTNSGLALHAAPLPRPDRALDTLVIAGGSGVHAAVTDRAVTDWVRRRAAHTRRIVSICTGAFLLAAAGLLGRRRAVTHWRACDDLARLSPSTRVEADPIYVRDGRVWTSAGVTAGIDLTLALVEEDLGHAIAMAVARDLIVFLKRPGGQSQFSRVLALQSRDDAFADLHAWVADNLGRNLSVPALAARATMSVRSFVRRYRAATGLSPARAIERMRVEAAQQLLCGTALPVKRIARRCGFGSEETLRQCFQRQLGVAPREFRQRFSAARPEPRPASR